MRYSRWGIAIAAILVIVSIVGCAHRTQNGQTVPVSPWEQVLTDNDLLAHANKMVAETTINVQATFPDKLSTQQAARILVAQKRIADVDQTLTGLLQQGPTVATPDEVARYVARIRAAVDDMVSSGDLSIKSPESQQTIKAYVDSISSLAESVLNQVQTLQASPPVKGSSLVLPIPMQQSGTPPVALLITQLVGLALSTAPLAFEEAAKIRRLLAANPDVQANLKQIYEDTTETNAETIKVVDDWLAAHGLDADGKPLVQTSAGG
jgi:hypothetical protein